MYGKGNCNNRDPDNTAVAEQPERFWNFLKEVRSELHKVVGRRAKKFGRRQRW